MDALCIGQSNIDERSQQVTLMTQIYGMGDAVLIYLDNATQNGRMSLVEGMSGMPANDAFFAACVSASWFNRARVLQEVFLAKRALILCENGTREWDWAI
jgi:hypothetical protein